MEPICGTLRTFKAGMELFEQGGNATDVYFIREGAVKLTVSDSAGRDAIVAISWPGNFLGVTSAIRGHCHDASAIALTRCIVEEVPSAIFLGKLLRDDELNWRLHFSQAAEIHDLSMHVQLLSSVSTKRRVLDLISEIARNPRAESARAQDGRLICPLNKRELAQFLGVTAEHFSRILRELADEGILQLKRQWIVIPNIQKLPTSRQH